MQTKEIAQVILNQIRQPSVYVFMSWGAKNFIVELNRETAFGYVLGGLSFKVNGMKVKGHVSIYLMGNDTYTVFIRNKEGDIVFRRDDVYCDEIQSVIDEVVEKVPEYKS